MSAGIMRRQVLGKYLMSSSIWITTDYSN